MSIFPPGEQEIAAAHPTISLVFAVRDRVEQLSLCLESLTRQTVSAADFEVLVVDDGSAGPTRDFLRDYRPSYTLSVLRRRQQNGRAAVRNDGWRAAGGEIVVFLDGDVVALPTLVGEHRRLHAAWEHAPPLCVSGAPGLWRSAFTVAYPDFSPEQMLRLHALAALDPGLSERLRDAGGGRGRPYPLVGPDELRDMPRALERLGAGPAPSDAGARLCDPHAAPFLAFVTRDVSVRREVLEETGGFFDGFQRYGLADWEYGYRLYRLGARFCCSVAASCIHQEHPTGPGRFLDNAANYALFLERHPDAEVALMAAGPPWTDQGRYARLCAGYHRLRLLRPALIPWVDAVLMRHARAWAAWGEHPLGLPPVPQQQNGAASTDAALSLWQAVRDPITAELLRSVGLTH